MKYLIIYMQVINLITFCIYGLDKVKAKRNKYRIPEKVLLLLALFGGSPGALSGMYVFRHKTKHLKFKLLVPAFLIVHICLIVFLVKNGGLFA